ncbi:MAG: glycosyltransferase [Dysgonamonadaceae bacterium]|nr:glycosyltransferase [Dysgonamonadaceae bacterium]
MRKSLEVFTFIIPSLESGGMERVMSEIIKYISKKKHTECHLVLYGRTRKIFYDLPNNVKIYKPHFKFNNKYRSWMTIETMSFIRSTIKEIKPNIVLSFGERWNNLVLLSLYGLKISTFISDRSSPNKNHGLIHNNLRRVLYPQATGVIAQTEKAKELFKTQFNNSNIQVIGNPIREIMNINDVKRENIVVSVGRLINTKHFDRLIDIFSKAETKDWKLIIIGGDSNKQSNSLRLYNQIKELKLENKIILKDVQKNIDEHLLKASIFTFTSSSEGFPNVIGEAMSAGLPVIAYDCLAGPSEMIEDGKNGYLIPLFDDTLFVNKLQNLIDNKKQREKMGSYAKESIKKFSTERICEQFYNFITSNS